MMVDNDYTEIMHDLYSLYILLVQVLYPAIMEGNDFIDQPWLADT